MIYRILKKIILPDGTALQENATSDIPKELVQELMSIGSIIKIERPEIAGKSVDELKQIVKEFGFPSYWLAKTKEQLIGRINNAWK